MFKYLKSLKTSIQRLEEQKNTMLDTLNDYPDSNERVITFYEEELKYKKEHYYRMLSLSIVMGLSIFSLVMLIVGLIFDSSLLKFLCNLCNVLVFTALIKLVRIPTLRVICILVLLCVLLSTSITLFEFK